MIKEPREIYLEGCEPIDPAETIEVLGQGLTKIFGAPIELLDRPWPAGGGADLFAWDAAACTLYGFAWMAPGQLEQSLFALLNDWREFVIGRRDALIAHLGLEENREAPSVRLVLVGPEVPDSWLRVAETLALEIEFLKVHRLRRSGSWAEALYFERRRLDRAETPRPAQRIDRVQRRPSPPAAATPPPPAPNGPARSGLFADLEDEEIVALKALEGVLESPQP